MLTMLIIITINNDDKTAQIVKGSVFKEEMREINIGTGIEYDYNKTFAVRGGYFHESATKGKRQFFTFGIGLNNISGNFFDVILLSELLFSSIYFLNI